MIQYNKFQLIEIDRFPQFRGDLNLVLPVFGFQIFSRYLHIIIGSIRKGVSCRSTHDTQRHTQCATPHNVFYKNTDRVPEKEINKVIRYRKRFLNKLTPEKLEETWRAVF